MRWDKARVLFPDLQKSQQCAYGLNGGIRCTSTMVVFPPPSQNEYSLNNDDNYQGYTGFGILKESHISIHTYPEENKAFIDFYSCKNLNIPKNKEFIENYFIKSNKDKIALQVIKR